MTIYTLKIEHLQILISILRFFNQKEYGGDAFTIDISAYFLGK